MSRWMLWLVVALSVAPAGDAAGQGLEALLVEGEAVPGEPGLAYGRPDRVALNDAGQGLVMTEGVDGETFWARAGDGQPFLRLLGVGEPVPGIADALVDNFATQPVYLSATGIATVRVVVEGAGAPPGSNAAVVALDAAGGGVVLVARTGDAVPGTASTIEVLDQRPRVGDGGVVSFLADLTGVDADDGLDALLVAPSPGAAYAPVLVAGDPAPGLPAGVSFAGVEEAPLVDGRLVVFAYLAGPGIDGASDGSLWYGPPERGALSMLAREGQAVPGAEAGTVFEELQRSWLLADGRVAFLARTHREGVRRWTLFLADPAGGSMQSLVAEGDSAPGIAGAQIAFLGELGVGASGRFVGTATLEGAGIDAGNSLVALQGDADGFAVVAREGAELRDDVGADDDIMVADPGSLAFTTRDATAARWLHAVQASGEFRDVAAPGAVVEVGGLPRTVDVVADLGVATRGAMAALTGNGRLAFIVIFDDDTTAVLGARVSDLLFRDGFE